MHEKLDFARIPAPLKPLVQRGYEGEADAPLGTVIAGYLWPVPGTALHPSPAVSQGQVCARCPLLLSALSLSIPTPLLSSRACGQGQAAPRAGSGSLRHLRQHLPVSPLPFHTRAVSGQHAAPGRARGSGSPLKALTGRWGPMRGIAKRCGNSSGPESPCT